MVPNSSLPPRRNVNGSSTSIFRRCMCEFQADIYTSSGKHVVFGEVVNGMDIVKAVEKIGTRDGKVPSDKKVVVSKCGTV